MPRTREGEISANLERAKASIQAAKQLAEGGFYDFVASRAYYAVFYASTAMLLCEALEFSKHSGVISAIHRDFVRTGKLDEQYGKELRDEGGTHLTERVEYWLCGFMPRNLL